MSGITLGLDIGTNSVGSAWINTGDKAIQFGCNVFPAGINEKNAPNNQDRRGKRSTKRIIQRRAERKRKLRILLQNVGLLPKDDDKLRMIFGPLRNGEQYNLEKWNPWRLRNEGLERELEPYEFGRVLVHLNQRRGAMGFEATTDEKGKVKGAIDKLRMVLIERYATPEDNKRLYALHNDKNTEEFLDKYKQWIQNNNITYGRLMSDKIEENRIYLLNKKAEPKINSMGRKKCFIGNPIRNRNDSFLYHADREIIREEFKKLWQIQKSYNGKLSRLLTSEIHKSLDNPEEGGIWKHGGCIFEQRKTYWKVGTLGRCSLEPTDRCTSEADMYAQEFRVLDYVNNLRIMKGGVSGLVNKGEREAVLDLLRRPQIHKKKLRTSFELKDIEAVLKIDKKTLGKQNIPEGYIRLTIARVDGDDYSPPCDAFYRDIACGVFGEEHWQQMGQERRESVNQALLKFDPENDADEKKLRENINKWWGVSEQKIENFITAWKTRSKLENRLSLSRKAIQNLLPAMKNPDPERKDEYPNQIRARKLVAEDMNTAMTCEQRVRYAPKITPEFKDKLLEKYSVETISKAIYQLGMNKKARHYLKKHPLEFLPPAPTMANPVVRKAIHEVRRHLVEYLRKFGRRPDRVVIELARAGRQSAKVRDQINSKNKARHSIRKGIIDKFGMEKWPSNQREKAIERVLLCRQQNFVCPYTNNSGKEGECVYTGKSISESQAVSGVDVEIDHIVPFSRCGDNSINNKVLCYRDANRDKGSQTSKEWFGKDSTKYEAMKQRMRHLDVGKNEHGPSKEDYFTKKDYKRKWENLTRDVLPDEFRNSQLSDTAYAAKQVGDYLRSALYEGETGGKQCVFFVTGKLTARLRNDWLLYPEIRETIQKEDPNAYAKDQQNQQKKLKDRSDHRHHAIDAVVIAFAPDYINQIAQEENYREEYYKRTGYQTKPKRMKAPNPWKSPAEFREDVLSNLYETYDKWDNQLTEPKRLTKEFVISHRPERRKLVGAFHKDHPYGKTNEENTYVRRELLAELLKKDSARWVIDIRDKGIRKIIENKLKECGIKVQKKQGKGRPSIKFVDIKTGEAVKDQDVKLALEDLCMRSGVPVRSIRIASTITNPVSITRKKDDVARYYESGSNHHIEILEDAKTKIWYGESVRTWDAYKRNADRLKALKDAGIPSTKQFRELKRKDIEAYKKAKTKYTPIIREINGQFPITNRKDRDGKFFIMSLAIGEMVYLCHKDAKKPGYYVVFKIDGETIYFTEHSDARPDGGLKNEEGKVIPGTKREGFSVSAADLNKKCSFPDGTSPQKLWVSPLGEIKPVIKD